MHYPNKPHFKIFSSVVLGFLQYFLLTSNFEINHSEQDEMIAFALLTANTLIGSVLVGSTAYDIRKQFKSKIKEEIHLLQKETHYVENQLEKFEHIILDDATLLLGAKVYRPNPILGSFD